MSPRLPDLLLLTQTDERLAVLAERGHERAFAVLVERHRPSLMRVAGRLVGADGAEDVVQQTLLRAWSAIQAGTPVIHVCGWLHQILRNTAFSEHARYRPPEELPPEWGENPGPNTVLESRLILATVLGEIERLPEHQRAALVQTEFGGRSRYDIAADLGVSEGAVRQLVHRARNALRVAVTALTPYPLAAWTTGPRPGSPLSHRIAQLGGHRGSGAHGVGGTLLGGGALKAGVVVLATGALGGGLVVRAVVPQEPDGSVPHVRAHRTARTALVRASSATFSAARGPLHTSSAVPVALSVLSNARPKAVGAPLSREHVRLPISRSSPVANGSPRIGDTSSGPVSDQPSASAGAPVQVGSGTSSDQASSGPRASSSNATPGADSSNSYPVADSSSSGPSSQQPTSDGTDASTTGSAPQSPSGEQPIVGPDPVVSPPTSTNPADPTSSSPSSPGD